jgi:hypothetical protein
MRISALIVLLVGIAALLPAEVDQQITTTIDWESGALFMTVRRPLPDSGPNLPAGISEVRSAIERDSTAIVIEQLRLLRYDSLRTVDELLIEEPYLVESLLEAASGARMMNAHATTDLRNVEVVFQLDLYGALLGALIRHDRPIPIPSRLGWTPTTDYTGIVIYAADELPVHGTGMKASLEPSLLPGIYSLTERGDGVTRLMEAGHVDPEYAVQWGPVFYTDDVVGAELNQRIGARPLRIIAYGAFGRYPTDVVISYDDAQQILANENNRSLITQGRIAIVVSSDQM